MENKHAWILRLMENKHAFSQCAHTLSARHQLNMTAPTSTTRSVLARILEPWKNKLDIYREPGRLAAHITVDCCSDHHGSLQILALLMMALKLDPNVLQDLREANWFRRCDGAFSRIITVMYRVREHTHVASPFDRVYPNDGFDSSFASASQTLTSLGSFIDPVVIPIVVHVEDDGTMAAHSYAESLPKLLRQTAVTIERAVRFEVTSVTVSIARRKLYSQLVEAMAMLAREWQIVTFRYVAIDPFLVSCSLAQFDSWSSAIATSSTTVAIMVDSSRQYDESQVRSVAPVVCRALVQCRELAYFSLGDILTCCRDHRAWRVILDSLVEVLTTTPVGRMYWILPDDLDSDDREFLREWARTSPKSHALLSTNGTELITNRPGIDFVKDLLPTVDHVHYRRFWNKWYDGSASFELFSIAPTKFASMQIVEIRSTSIASAELTAIVTLPHLESLTLVSVELDRDAFASFVHSLVPPVESMERFKHRRLRSLTLLQCTDLQQREHILDDAMGEVFLSVCRTNRYLQCVYVQDTRMTPYWAQVASHTGEAEIASIDMAELCAFLSVIGGGGALGNLDSFLVRTILQFSSPFARRVVTVKSASTM